MYKNLLAILLRGTSERSGKFFVTGGSNLASCKTPLTRKALFCFIFPKDEVRRALISLPANREPFTSIAVALGSRVSYSPKLKAKIWANEFIEFGSFVTAPPNQDRYSVCLTPSSNLSNQPRLTIEPCQPSKKKIHTFMQRLLAPNIFAAIFFSEKLPSETLRLIRKYNEIFATFLLNPATGISMTNSFVIYDSQPLTSTSGIPFIGNYAWIKAVINFRAKAGYGVSTHQASPVLYQRDLLIISSRQILGWLQIRTDLLQMRSNDHIGFLSNRSAKLFKSMLIFSSIA